MGDLAVAELCNHVFVGALRATRSDTSARAWLIFRAEFYFSPNSFCEAVQNMKISAKHQTTLAKLVRLRGDVSLIDEELATATRVRRVTDDWVPMWIDLDHAVRSDRLGATAYRAITDDGELLWYVCRDGKKKGYHALGSQASDAFDEAEGCWKRRKEIKKNWAALQALRWDLLVGRTQVPVTLSDAHQSGLCTLGVQGFLRRIGRPTTTRISGRFAAILMWLEPQAGYALYAAAASHGLLPSASPTSPQINLASGLSGATT